MASRKPAAARRLEAIAASLEGRGDVELDNLAVDLQAVERRLITGQYAEADFVTRNVFDVARRTREYLTYLRGWQTQAAQWSELLKSIDPSPTDVLDLCPGPAPKIELALHQMGFRGRVRILDKDGASIRALTDFMALFAPSFRIEGVEGDVFDEPAAATGKLVVANHAIDDLVLDLWASPAGASVHELYEDEAKLASAWRALLAESDRVLSAMPERIAAALARHVAPGGQLVLVQYPSHHEGLLGVDGVGALFQSVLERVLAALKEKGFSDVSGGARVALAGKRAAVLRAPRDELAATR